ncbi:MAG: S1 RNA-binding domain-containing protein [Abditibacteriota bacterium]|nr:S1 RNA-binding domain-containing protein [Abditibacteriota bacterium]
MSDTVDNSIRDDNITMDQVMADMDNAQEIYQGKIVEGTVVKIDKDGVMVDIGGKSEAKIPVDQLSAKEAENLEEAFKIGDEVKARVIQAGSKDGIILSKKSIDYELRWDEIQKLYEEKQIVSAVVKEVNKGGLKVDLLGHTAFCPNSQVWGKPDKKKYNINGREVEVASYDKFVGETLEFEIKDIDKNKHNIILSNRDVVRKQKEKERKAFWKGIYEGQTRTGVVKSLTNFGAFVSLDKNYDGLLHISEMSWNKINSPKEVLSVGDEIQVYVKSADQKQNKISLSLKEILPDPWNDIPEKYPVDSVFEGKITRVAQKAAFVDLGNGVEGIIPISEMSVNRINVCGDMVKPGDTVTVKVIYVSNEERKVTLSMKQIELAKIEKEEEAAYEEYQKEQESTSSFNIGEYFGDELKSDAENNSAE